MKARPAGDRRKQGEALELEAARALEAMGLRILRRNYRLRMGELDLICEEAISHRKIELVFVEVRTRSSSDGFGAIESVTYPKRLKLERTAQKYLLEYEGPAQSCRFDLLVFEAGRWTHLRDAWRPGS